MEGDFKEQDREMSEMAYARLQLDRERARAIHRAIADTRALQEELAACVRRAGVNRYAHCRKETMACLEKIRKPWYGAFEAEEAEVAAAPEQGEAEETAAEKTEEGAEAAEEIE
ncbi:hypothetical protein CDCA_CDCA09G2596 [Cyanidium caldarium]|uniref:COX assembly mitochondrial protein n=1 Tax=Cyanidium caldarium TaxID=2771 RepID=A0AAV9IWN3_CYACA|nr:hypothetical protein CDCA_CDCA09G2596 [Cyanidium caldarium]